ncbi:Histidine triad nucleotide-binding protein 3 [Chytriomyces hyalinus]|nr:Histidine triad nucleotide-binding protein 3 [Chytriomyces hyalinus]
MPATILYEDDEVVAFADISPVADLHVLICPKNHIRDCNALTEEHRGLLSKIKHVAETQIAGYIERNCLSASDVSFAIGFQRPPLNSINHLHCHVTSEPIRPATSWIRKVMIRFGFVSIDQVAAALK